MPTGPTGGTDPVPRPSMPIAHWSPSPSFGDLQGTSWGWIALSRQQGFRRMGQSPGLRIRADLLHPRKGEPTKMAMKIPVDTLFYATIVVKDLRVAARNYAEFY